MGGGRGDSVSLEDIPQEIDIVDPEEQSVGIVVPTDALMNFKHGNANCVSVGEEALPERSVHSPKRMRSKGRPPSKRKAAKVYKPKAKQVKIRKMFKQILLTLHYSKDSSFHEQSIGMKSQLRIKVFYE
ncbi:hypothetical protein QJS10_CPA09g01049 [Acorus calamus]|uniref:Uncharacterized protein n=1 Tax=Acorus calamus TaxID=4465 RepID=A0AAV9E7I2_ACOCL|nr:hypothetical protein QJS10_CPA09g01049 [Acorus calamus]